MKADSTLRTSRAVPHPSTNRALCRLTSEVERDPVHSTRYGRQRATPQAARGPKNRVFARRPAMLATARRPALVPADVDDRHRHHRDDHGAIMVAMVLSIADSNGHAHDSDGGMLAMIIIPATMMAAMWPSQHCC
jgi:hypothetical protein